LVAKEYLELTRRLSPVTGQPELRSPCADWQEVAESSIDTASESRIALRANPVDFNSPPDCKREDVFQTGRPFL